MQKKKHITYLHRLVSAFLLLLFLCVHLVEVFHAPHNSTDCSTGDNTEQRYTVADQNCKICDYLAHTRQGPFSVSTSIVLSIPLPKAIEVSGRVVARIYKFTLQGFSNKGPPRFT
ncbi:hypothetical protein [Desertivirga brevis]|uniref:hypothetical protein n=1 Tax=Desertivirga brevis TaxID=2810310 RepID=UPI001A964359|nr:hypothetical protein [Pedobacter sp. SYSU D00873]